MPAEHLDENGNLRQGYFCSRCGEAVGMYGHSGQANRCKVNIQLVVKLQRMNSAGSVEEYLIRKLRGDYDT